MRTLAIAIHDFHDVHSALPTQFNRDKDDKPLLSWRVHLLPFLDEEKLYKQFRLDEPWDSENNLKLVEKMPRVFRHPKLNLEPGHTVYFGLAGKHSVWRLPSDDASSKGLSLFDVVASDGTSQTAMLIEVAIENSAVWSRPVDFDVDQEGFAEKLTAIWTNGLNVAMSDAGVYTYRADLTESQWRSLFNFRDGEKLDLKSLRSPK